MTCEFGVVCTNVCVQISVQTILIHFFSKLLYNSCVTGLLLQKCFKFGMLSIYICIQKSVDGAHPYLTHET